MITPRAAQAVDPNAARRDARKILSDGRYRSNPAPRPLRSPLQWIGDRMQGVVNWIGSVLRHIPRALLLLIVLALLAVVIAFIVRAVRRRRVTGGPPAAGPALLTNGDAEDPDVLERRADEAERDGDLDRAVRLRFRAGLLRLGRRGAIASRPSVTTGEVRRALGSRTFDELAETFEHVTYAGTPAAPPDVDAARRKWPAVLEEAKPR